MPVFSTERYFKTGFDCAKAATRIENTICSVQKLADADIDMTLIYKDLLSVLTAEEKMKLKENQIAWLSKRARDCDGSELSSMAKCLGFQYRHRIDLLRHWPRTTEQQSTREESLYTNLISSDKTIQESATSDLNTLDVASKEIIARKLVFTLKTTPDEAIRRRAATALTKIGAPSVTILIETYSDKDHIVRLYVIEILGNIGASTADVIPTLIRALKDPDDIVRMVAADGLGKLKPAPREAINGLINATADKDSAVRSRACRALGSIGPDAMTAVPALVAVLEDQNEGIHDQSGHALMRNDAAIALGKIGTNSNVAISALIKTLKDKQNFVRSSAADALAKLGTQAVPALVQALKDADIYTRIEAARAIGQYAPFAEGTESALIGALSDDNYAVRSMAAFALRKYKSEVSLLALQQYKEDERLRYEQVRVKRERDMHKTYTKGEIVSTIPSDSDNKYPLELVYAFSIVTYNQNELYVTLHRGIDRPDLLRIWVKVDDSYAIIKELKGDEEGQGHYGEVTSFYYTSSAHKREYFIHIPLFFSGTGGGREDAIYCILPDLTLQEVAIEPAPVWIKDKLQAGEGVWKGERFSVSSDKLEFEFYIWNEDDANCCPTAGRVTGTYKIVGSRNYDTSKKKEVASFKMIVDTYERQSVGRNRTK